MKIKDLPKNSYVYRYKPILFWGHGEGAPMRKGDELDKWDKVFSSKEEFTKWHRELTIGLAELDEVLNYCEYFIREKGNIGAYEREGKRFYPVDGTWDGYHMNTPMMQDFKKFLIENKWFNEGLPLSKQKWFKLMQRYV